MTSAIASVNGVRWCDLIETSAKIAKTGQLPTAYPIASPAHHDLKSGDKNRQKSPVRAGEKSLLVRWLRG
jgi:hypothetical protein